MKTFTVLDRATECAAMLLRVDTRWIEYLPHDAVLRHDADGVFVLLDGVKMRRVAKEGQVWWELTQGRHAVVVHPAGRAAS